MKIIIIYHSGFGHTKIVAQYILQGLQSEISDATMLSTLEALDQMELLHDADALIFGSPTYFGSVSAEFKKFIEVTGTFWYAQKWKDKLAAGFTNSSTLNGDKLVTLQQLSIFAAQHGMIWISTGIVPKFIANVQADSPNQMASYLGLMTLSDNATREVNLPHDLETAVLFGQRIAQITKQFKSNI